MRGLLLPLKLLGLLLLAALLSGGWLFRDQILRQLRPQVSRVTGALTGADAGVPDAAGLTRARDKADSLHGWHADSVLLSASEMASLVREGLPPEVRDRMDSLRLDLGEARLTVSARLETSRIPADALGPLAGALEPDAVVERALRMSLELLRAVHRDERGAGDQAAVAFRQAGALPHVAEQHLLGELDKLGNRLANRVARG